MLYGMGTVFIFLTILVFATTLMSRLVCRFASEEVDTPLRSVLNASETQPSPAIKQAIELAIAKHRRR